MKMNFQKSFRLPKNLAGVLLLALSLSFSQGSLAASSAQDLIFEQQKLNSLMFGFEQGSRNANAQFEVFFSGNCAKLYAGNVAFQNKVAATGPLFEAQLDLYSTAYISAWIAHFVSAHSIAWKVCEADLNLAQKQAFESRYKECEALAASGNLAPLPADKILNLPSAKIPNYVRSVMLSPSLRIEGKMPWEFILSQNAQWVDELPCQLGVLTLVYKILGDQYK
jgi:hypothetical protein